MRAVYLTSMILLLMATAYGQDEEIDVEIDGQIVKMMIFGEDTLLVADLDDVEVESPRSFKNNEDYRYWRKCRYHARKVYPYAVEAIEVFRKVEAFSKDSKRRERKKYIKSLQKELKAKYEDPLKNLTKTQGKILTEMIERELDISTFDLIRELKGGVKASFWSGVGRFWGYRLKEKYNPEDDPILESVLQTFKFPKSS